MTVLGLFQLQLLPQDLGLSRRKSLPLHQLSESLANRTSGRVVCAAPVVLRTVYRHSMVSRTLGVANLVLKAKRCAKAMSCAVSIGGPMAVIT